MLPRSKSIRAFALSLRTLASAAAAEKDHLARRAICPVRNPSSQTLATAGRRSIASERGGGGGEVEREIDLINVKFGEAREEIEMAMESKETVYFDEEAECAREAVKEVLERFEGLLVKVKEGEREALRRSMGLKMEQLKAELKQLDD